MPNHTIGGLGFSRVNFITPVRVMRVPLLAGVPLLFDPNRPNQYRLFCGIWSGFLQKRIHRLTQQKSVLNFRHCFLSCVCECVWDWLWVLLLWVGEIGTKSGFFILRMIDLYGGYATVANPINLLR